MKKMWILIIFLIQFAQAADGQAPVAERIPKYLKKHGDTRVDNYFWMREKSSEKVINHLKAENDYTSEVMRDTKDLQEKLYNEMRSRVKEDDQSVAYKDGDFIYYSKTLKGNEYSIYFRKKDVPGALEEVILDVNELGKGLDYINVTYPSFHFNQQLFAYAVDTKGDRVHTIYFKNLATGETLDQKIENVTGDFVWAETGRIIFYSKHDPQTLRSDKIYKYDLDTKKSTLIFNEKDEKRDVYISKTLTRKYILITSSSALSSEVRYIPANIPDQKFKVFEPRKLDHEYSVYDGGDRFYVLTNWKAKNFRLMEVGLTNTSRKNWKEVIAHRPDVLIESVVVFKNYLATSESFDGLNQLYVLKRGETKGDYIKFPDPAYWVGFEINIDYNANFLRYDFGSMNRPYSAFSYDFEKKNSVLLKEKEFPNYNSAEYESERIFASAVDGAKIPISLVYKKGLKKDGSAPILLYGYASYGMSMSPYFSSTRVSLLDRGFIFAIIHARGGSEMGRHWYEDGKFFKKKNTFTDFIAGTEYLIKNGYCSPKLVFANGESAGGLLMGAIMNLRPDLYKGIIAGVPFVDVVTTMLDSSLPLTTGEYEEWGNPNNKKYYEYMKSYSPYDNVKPQDYPNLLVTTGLNDSQVSYWEPAKWVAKLRELRTDKSKLMIMKTEMEVGHGGKSGRYEYLRDAALNYAFILKLSGMK